MYYNEELVHKFKFQTQLSRKLQRFRTCRKNKKCSIFHYLIEYIIFSYDCKLLGWSFNSCSIISLTINNSQKYHCNNNIDNMDPADFLAVLPEFSIFGLEQ